MANDVGGIRFRGRKVRVSQMYLAIDVRVSCRWKKFTARIEKLVALIKSTAPAPGYDEVMVAGDLEWRDPGRTPGQRHSHCRRQLANPAENGRRPPVIESFSSAYAFEVVHNIVCGCFRDWGIVLRVAVSIHAACHRAVCPYLPEEGKSYKYCPQEVGAKARLLRASRVCSCLCARIFSRLRVSRL